MKDSNHTTINQEISLREVIDFFEASWKKILIGGIVGAILGISSALTIPTQHQATGYIQTGKVANQDIESASLLVSKLKIPTFFSTNTLRACQADGNIEPGLTLAKQLNPLIMKDSAVVTISYVSKTPEIAKKCLENVLADIRLNQSMLADPLILSKKNQLANLKQKLTSTEEITKIWSTKNANFDFNDAKFSASSLLLATTLSKENEIRDLIAQINELKNTLAEPQTKEAYFTAPIYSPNNPLPRKTTLIVFQYSVSGCLLVIVFLLGLKSFKKLRQVKPL